jgi:hypothetical protein
MILFKTTAVKTSNPIYVGLSQKTLIKTGISFSQFLPNVVVNKIIKYTKRKQEDIMGRRNINIVCYVDESVPRPDP